MGDRYLKEGYPFFCFMEDNKMQLSQILNLVIEWGSDADLNGVNFNLTVEERDKIIISKG